MLKLDIEELTWAQARADVQKVNPDLAKIIDEIDPGDEYTLIKAKYPFGAHILDKGVLHIPSNMGIVRADHPEISEAMKEKLLYLYTMPMGVVLKNCIELYMTGEKVVPYSLMSPGKIFAIYSALDNIKQSTHSGHTWSISSGGRSLSMIPKISDGVSYRKLQKHFRHFSVLSPPNMMDQWKVFSGLASHPEFQDKWASEVLFFTSKWHDQITADNMVLHRKSPTWLLLRSHLLTTGWRETAFLRNQIIFDRTISEALIAKNLRPDPYLTDVVKHLYFIGTGVYPAFVIATDDRVGPIAEFQKIFIDIYGLKYAPLMVHLGYYKRENQYPCYYSFGIPTLIEFSPKAKKGASKIQDLDEVRHVMNNVISYVMQNKLGLENTPIFQWAEIVNYKYIHTDVTVQNNTLQLVRSSELIDHDVNIQKEMARFSSLDFPENSQFFGGCIRV